METNQYARQWLATSHQALADWMDFTVKDMASYLGLIVLMDVAKVLSIKWYRSKFDTFSMPIFGKTMPVNLYNRLWVFPRLQK